MQEEVKKVESEFYVVRTINMVAENATAAILGYNEKVVKKAVESGRVLADEAKKNTLEAVAGIVEDGKKVMAKIPMVETIAPKPAEDGDVEYYVIKTFQKAAEEATAALKDYNQAVKKTFENPKELIETKRAKAVETGKAMVDAAKKTMNEAVEGVTADGKKLAEKATSTVSVASEVVRTKAQGAIDSGLAAVTRALDLPTRTDIKELTAAMTEFNKKADQILAAQAA